MRRQLLAGATAACTLLAASAAGAQSYDRLVVFGDSLSDSGNTFRASRGTNPPSPPYFNGRFSNGPVFTELLGFSPLSLAGVVTGNTNYAFGGAETVGPGRAGVPSVQQQLQLFTAGGGRFGSADLVSVFGGANNILNAFPQVGAAANPLATLQGIAVGAAADIGRITGQIAGAGAGTVVVYNLPSFGALPAFNTGPAALLAEQGSQTFNAALAGQINTVAGANVGTNFILVDVARFNAEVLLRPGEFGFTNTTQSCLTAAGVCANPDRFLYWDSVHPTAASSRGLAALTQDYIYYGRRGAARTALGETSLLHREAAHDSALERLGEGAGGGGVRIALAVDGAQTTDQARGDVPEIERNTSALRISGDAFLQPGVMVGVQAHAGASFVEAGPLEVEVNSLGADAYLGLERGPVFLHFVIGGSTDEYSDYRRATGVGPIVHTADRISGASYGGKLQAGYRFLFGDAELSPRVAISAVRTEVDPFGENGASARQAARIHDIEAVAGEASLRLETPLSDGRFRGHLEGGFGDFFSYDGEVATALADNPARPIVSDIEAPGRGAILKAGLRGELFGGVQLGVGYQGRFDDSRDSHSARLTLSYRTGG